MAGKKSVETKRMEVKIQDIIKNASKKNGIWLSELASKLKISRQMLDYYLYGFIKTAENGRELWVGGYFIDKEAVGSKPNLKNLGREEFKIFCEQYALFEIKKIEGNNKFICWKQP
jgi:hypothetical protein